MKVMGTDALHKTAKLSLGTHQLASKEVERLNTAAKKKPAGKGERRTMTAYLEAAIHYFAERGMDPAEMHEREGALILQEVRRLGDRVFSYLQDQEQHVHQSLLQELVRTRITQQVILAALQDVEGVLNHRTPEEIKITRKQDNDRIERDVAKVLRALSDATNIGRAESRAARKGAEPSAK
jgi:hypothetical protein